LLQKKDALEGVGTVEVCIAEIDKSKICMAVEPMGVQNSQVDLTHALEYQGRVPSNN